MELVNESEELQKQLREMEQLKKAKHNLQVFLDSFEGDSKTTTNTHAEESAIEYWKNILEKGKNDFDRSLSHMKSQIDQSKATYEKTKAYLESQLEQARLNHEKAVNHLQGQIQQCETNFAAQQQNIGSRLDKAKDNLQRKVSKKKPKQQLDLEITVQKLEESIKRRDAVLAKARKENRCV